MISPVPVITTSSAEVGRTLELQLAAVSQALFPPPPSHVTVAACEWMRKREANRVKANGWATFIATFIEGARNYPRNWNWLMELSGNRREDDRWPETEKSGGGGGS